MDSIVQIVEVGPRDGLQNESTLIPTNQKLTLVDKLAAAGLQRIELTSFVHPKAVPQMVDAEEVMGTTLCKHGGTSVDFSGLALNERGYERALAAGCRSMAFGVAVSDSFSQNNTRMSSQDALAIVGNLVKRAQLDNVRTRVYLMTAWVCPFVGPINPVQTLYYAEKIWEMGIDELAIADTIGYAHPLEVGQLCEQIGRRTNMDHLAVHLHDTQALGLANSAAAISAGVRIVDSSIGGLGGCPFAPGAAGNLATEDLAFMLYKMGLGTGIDFDALWEAVYYIERLVGRPLGGRIRDWWQASCDIEPILQHP